MHSTRVTFGALLLLLPFSAAGADLEPWNVGVVRAASTPAPLPDARAIVAVLDSGIFPDAPALADTLILPGWDFVEGDDDPTDDNGHGTHIAALVAGWTGPGGPLCPECAVLPVKVLDSRGLGDIGTLAAGLRYAADEGAQVINMSMGFDPGYDPGPDLAEAVAYAREKGAVLVASVGNEGRVGLTYPASYPGVIGVAALDYDGRRTPYSNISPAVDVSAPGGDDQDRDGDGVPESILSDGLTLRGGKGVEPWLYSGTSQAAAHVSALAGRLLARGVPPDRVEAVMTATARDVGPAGFDLGNGAGLIDFSAALEAIEGPLPLPWRERYRYLTRRLGNDRLEILLQDHDGRALPGAVLFGHWRGTLRVVVAEADTAGRIVLDAGRSGAEDLHVERIAEDASAQDPDLFLTPNSRPYQGILASPLSRFPR